VAAVVVLAAGGGTRMKSATSKLLHEVAGRPMLSYAVAAASALRPEHLVVVVGQMKEQVLHALAAFGEGVETAEQPEPKGTGDAVACGLRGLDDLAGEVVVTYGDVPLLEGETLVGLVETHRREAAGVTILTADVPDPAGYGRVVRANGEVVRIVEHRDATPEEQAITEINSGIYVFDSRVLREGLSTLTTHNDQGELYLTDIVTYCRGAGGRVATMQIADTIQTQGVNTRVELARMNAVRNQRLCEKWMLEGVTIIDPATTWLHDSVDLAADVTILPGTHLYGATSVASGATIGPDTTLVDCVVGEGATVVRAHGQLAEIGPGASVGPFSYMRPGTILEAGAKVGAFVETKNAHIGEGAKVPHLTYCGDAEIGSGANIGAGTIFANYDGVGKYKTSVGKASFVGSDSVLVAPVTIADGAYIAAGSTITNPVGPGELGVARGQQRNIPGWVARRRAGTSTEEAAQAALASLEDDAENVR
jgi:bifunctional UDP-N-acetylglucosamine pyrophosphorylase/glucosamine-1-phosphate N-acetyltransferase